MKPVNPADPLRRKAAAYANQRLYDKAIECTQQALQESPKREDFENLIRWYTLQNSPRSVGSVRKHLAEFLRLTS